MYEELLPYWKASCQQRHKLHWGFLEYWRWVSELENRHYSRKWYMAGTQDPVVLGTGGVDCLVNGVMLFTWEAGIEP